MAPLGPGGADVGHGFERTTEAAAGTHGVAGDAFDLAVVAGEEADEEVGLMEGPGAEDDGFAGVKGDAALWHDWPNEERATGWPRVREVSGA